jgi:hypothetical protein
MCENHSLMVTGSRATPGSPHGTSDRDRRSECPIPRRHRRPGGTTTRVGGGPRHPHRLPDSRWVRGLARLGHVRRARLRVIGGGGHPPPRSGGQCRAPTPVQGAGRAARPGRRTRSCPRRALERQQRAHLQRPLRRGADPCGHHAPRHVRLPSGARCSNAGCSPSRSTRWPRCSSVSGPAWWPRCSGSSTPWCSVWDTSTGWICPSR